MNINEEITAELNRISDQVKAALNGPVSELREKQIELQAMYTDLAQKAARRGGDPIGGGQSIDVIVKKVCDDPGIKSLASGQTKNSATVQLGGLGFLKKTLITGTTFPGAFERLPVPFGNDARRKLRLIDVLAHIPMETGAVQYIQLGNYSNAANYQIAEGDLKAEANVPTILVTAEAATIAHWLPTSNQVLADVAGLEQQLRGLLLFGLLDKLEKELINGTGAPGTIYGLINTANAYVAAGAPADRIGEASAELGNRGWIPTTAILNPFDWFAISSERGSNGEYVAGGWNMPANPNIWNMDLVISSSMAKGTAIVLDSQQVAILDRQQSTLDVGYISDQFIRNELTLRAELRAQLATYSPSAVLKVSLI